ncbi:phycobiliprotein lyase [Geminocystis sp. NIES-3709]|uniref:phycobiliprotein lyase n=1 Tax=Geminocystis sp. NIES-3709 TaxID=1617448 RepID=UPI0005FC755A|nr:phycobiliprotein lyase [Geminocystis sp. NIES-3709]BAQ65245.1 phycoerythrin linker protein CpeS homolog [Geminocystis sp. NIES-3709]
MNIHTFLEKTAGDWFSQRTIYDIANNEVDNSKANLSINFLSPTNSQISQQCQQYNLNLDLSLGAIKSKWDNSPDWGKPKQIGDSLMLIFRDDNEDNQGQILRILTNKDSLIGKYILAEDESLTLIIDRDSQYIEERIWFASDNLRLRNTIVKNNQQIIQTSFYSEIRRIISN